MASRLTGNFAQSRVPTRSESLRGLFQDFNKSRQNIMDNEIAGEDRLLREKALRQQQDNADRGFELREEAAKQQALQDEFNQGATNAKLIIQADAAKAQAEQNRLNRLHQANVLKKHDEALKYKQGRDTRSDNIEAGKVIGQSIVPTSQMVDGTEEVTDTDKLGTYGKKLMSTIGTDGTIDKKQQHEGYLKYLKANNPQAYRAYVKSADATLRDSPIDEAGKSSNFMYNTMMGILPSSDSQADRDLKEFTKTTDGKKLLSRDEFLANYVGSGETAQYDNAAKQAVAEFLLSDQIKDTAITGTNAGKSLYDLESLGKEQAKLRSTTKAEQIADVNAKIAVMQQNNPGMSKDQVLGMKQAAYATIEKEEAKKYENAKVQASMMIDNLKLDRKHEKAKELAKYKADLDSKDPNKKRKAIMEIAKLSAQTKAIEKKLYESDSGLFGLF